MKSKNLKLTFYGGAGIVTGANFVLETIPSTDDKEKHYKIMIDCGLIQGSEENEKLNRKDFKYNPSEIDVLVVTHAHIDHIGRVPKLVKDGFNGKIYSTPATKEIAKLMLSDAHKIMTYNFKKTREKPIYEKENIDQAMVLWKELEYHQSLKIGDYFKLYFKDAGHILGSVMAEIKYEKRDEKEKFVFTGDLGNSPEPLLRGTEFIDSTDYLIMESVYGDRNHEPNENRVKNFKRIILETINKKGTLLIPTLSLERTQIILFELNKLIEDGHMPSIPVFLDSPLAIKATEIYRNYERYFNKEVQERIRSGDDIFHFPKLRLTETREESKQISETKGPKIIIAGSGMSMGGRVIFHEKRYLSDPKNTMLFVSYQVPGSLGRQILDGNKSVKIFGRKILIRAKIEKIMNYSSHKDSDGLLELVDKINNKPKKVFLAMGEPKSSMFLAQKIKDNFGIESISPSEGDSFIL